MLPGMQNVLALWASALVNSKGVSVGTDAKTDVAVVKVEGIPPRAFRSVRWREGRQC